MLTSQRPRPDQVRMLERELALRSELDPAWAVRPLALAQHQARPVLILENQPGDPLPRVLETPAMELALVLRLAASLAAALGEVHRRGIIHKNIKPAHILVNVDIGQVWLTGFGIASRLPRERQAPDPPEAIAGTLAYMAPEQTGRMNRSIDARSDLYSLGVTLYEMLTGALPFTAADPMELVHCHIARQATPPSERVKEVPPPLSAIVMKLLAKTAEERYQTAAGLERDLQRCLSEFETEGRIDDFALGERDTPDRLLIPEKLYGRAREVETLLAAFERIVRGGAPELVLVSGYSGIGKSAVVNELHKVLVPPRGLFAAGKFDQYKRDIPYSTVAQAFQSLIRSLLAKSDDELADLRGTLRDALGPNGQLMIDLVPELKLIIGEQASVPELLPQDAQRRFQLVFRRFLAVFARPEHPLALFLDDLQWLDAATLDLLEDLLTQIDLRYLLLIGAYRDNEVTSAHPLMRKLEAIRASGRVQDIKLGPLTTQDLGGLAAESLRCDAEQNAPLAGMVHEKTGGNPFFVIQFLHVLADEGLLAFDHKRARWSWDLDRIDAKRYTRNIVDLMVGKLSRLPSTTQDVLRQFACLGNSAKSAFLAMVCESSKQALDRDLDEALRAGLVVPSGDSYRFLHDRIQEAAYSMIAEARRAEAHLRIGRLLAVNTPVEKRDEEIFEIVSQLNRGAALITLRDEKEQLAEFNLIAGKRAKASTAYLSALTYLVAGAALLSEGWEHRPDLMFALELQRAECEFLTGALSDAEQRLMALSMHVATAAERANVAGLRVELYTTLGQIDGAVAVGLDYLCQVGIEWSPHPTDEEVRREYARIRSQLGTRSIEELIDLPVMRDPATLAVLDVLNKLSAPAMFTDANLMSLVVCRIVNLSLERGNSDASCCAYVWLGGSVAGPHFGDYKVAFRFGQLGYDLVEQRGLTRFQARTYLSLAYQVMPWTKHVKVSRDLLRRCFEAANKTGDLTVAAYSCQSLNAILLAAGDPLVDVQHEAEHGLAFAQKARFGYVIDVGAPQLGLIRTLRGLTPTFGTFDDEQFDELRTERRLSENPALAIPEFKYWVRKLQARFFASDWAAASEAASRAHRALWTSLSQFEVAEYHFYGALSRAALWTEASPDQRPQHFEALTAHQRRLEVWAENCPENFEDRAALIRAEIARIEGRELEAERLYEQAIRSARDNGFVHNEALANELAARFYATRGFETISHAYLRNARFGYLRWGADGKVRQLDQLYPLLSVEAAAVPASTGIIGALVEHLDLATVIKVSQTVSSEMMLDKLLDTLIRTAIEHAGAQRAVLVLSRDGKHHIAAEAMTSVDAVTVELCDKPVSATRLPETIVRYVLHTQENVILDDAVILNAFSTDPYLGQSHARSVLCLPLMNQAKLIGALYLENNLAPRVFAPARTAVLKLLASQAAISLENAHLYRDVAEREAKIRRLVDANIVGIFIWTLDGTILEANDAFLTMLGYERPDLVAPGLRWIDLTPPEWRERDERLMSQLEATGTLQPFEKEYFRKDGSRMPVLIGLAAFDETGNEGVAFVVDLTERKRAEQALRESERESQLIVHTIPGLVAILRPSGEVDFVNQELIAYCGQPLEAMKQWGTNGTVHSEDLPRVVQDFTRAITSGEPYDFEARIRRFDGVYRWLQIRGLPLRDTSGQIVRWYVLLSDIDDRKRAESDVRRAYQRFAEAQRVAALSTLTASIAHEVNQPLSGIITNASTCLRMLNADPANVDGARETARRTIRDGNRASEVIGRLRALFSKREFTPEPLDLNEAAREVIALSSNDLKHNRIDLETQLADGLPIVTGDRIQLQQVVVNLLRNASDAMDEVHDRPRQLLIKTEREASGRVRLSVRDAGVGLSPETLDSLFDPFYTTKSGGMGIGLFVSRSIVERHHGRLWAEANQGAPGATFAFSIPHSQDS